MTLPVRNPAALRLLIGWLVIAALTLGGLALAGFLPPHPGFSSIFLPAVVAVLFQGGAALMAVRQGHVRLGWIILLCPTLLLVATLVLVFVLYAVAMS
jgi:hypothetical protein